MTTKFTKGPWQVFMDGSSVGDSDGLGIAALWNDGDVLEANAALIACAPEMYEMLEKLSMQLTAINAHKAVDQIERLLAKARGEA